tara:strand:- start:775 stop:1002 length:228 start_codon:yes stop_codon:yes gene_type:complete
MIKSKEYKNKGIEIDLTGPQGNAYYLLGLASRWSKELQFGDSYREEMLEKMKSSDYENLIKVFDNEFGSVVTLYR